MTLAGKAVLCSWGLQWSFQPCLQGKEDLGGSEKDLHPPASLHPAPVARTAGNSDALLHMQLLNTKQTFCDIQRCQYLSELSWYTKLLLASFTQL